MSKPVTTTTTTTTTNTTAGTNTTKPANTTTATPVTVPKNTTTTTPVKPAPPASASTSTAPGDWFGSLIGWCWVTFWVYLYATFIVWWWTPLAGILFGNWTDFYVFFSGYSSSFGGAVASYT